MTIESLPSLAQFQKSVTVVENDEMQVGFLIWSSTGLCTKVQKELLYAEGHFF